MKIIDFSKARNQIERVFDRAADDADFTVITRQAAQNVVRSLDQFNGLMETVHLLKSPANAAHLSKSIQQYRAGKTEELGLIDN